MKIIDTLYRELKADVRNNARRIQQLDNVADVAGVASTVPTSALGDAPLLADGQRGYALRFISDALKSGESPGAGTGCLAYYDPASDSWLNVRDDTAVSV